MPLIRFPKPVGEQAVIRSGGKQYRVARWPSFPPNRFVAEIRVLEIRPLLSIVSEASSAPIGMAQVQICGLLVSVRHSQHGYLLECPPN